MNNNGAEEMKWIQELENVTPGPIQLGDKTAFQTEDLENLDLLIFDSTDHAHNSRDAFTSFCPMIEKVFTSLGERNFSFGRGTIRKRFVTSNITFTNVMYVPTLVNNLYSASHLQSYGWALGHQLEAPRRSYVHD